MPQPALSARAEATARRTYHRPLDAAGSKFETWAQVIERAHVAHHRRLWAGAGGTPDERELAELRDLGLSRAGLVAGRTLWLGGTEYAYSRAASQFNCSALELVTVYDMVDAFWLLLNGCGVGGLPRSGTLHGYARPIPLEVVPSRRPADWRGVEDNVETYGPPAGTGHEDGYTEWRITVGDSAAAWAKCLGKMLVPPNGRRADKLILDFSNVRGPGARLRGYGWICNGYEPLAEALSAVHAVLNRCAGNLLDEEDIGDIFNWCGTVLSSRRAAEALVLPAYHPRAAEFARRKQGYYLCSACGHWDTKGDKCQRCGGRPTNPQRRQSNNSLLFWTKPSTDDLVDLLRLNLAGGDPGFVNAAAALRKCPWFTLFNPCATGDTLVAVADGRNAVPIAQLAEESAGVNRFDVYSAKPAGINRFGRKWKTEISSAVAIMTGVKPVGLLTLSTGDTVRLTADHRVALADGTYCEAAKAVGREVESFFTKRQKGERRLINSESNGFAKQCRMIWERANGPKPAGYEIDHLENGGGDYLDNLQLLTAEDHRAKTSGERMGDANSMHKIADKAAYRRRKAVQAFGASNPRHSGLTDEYLIELATILHRDGVQVTLRNLRALDARVPSSFSKNRFGGSVAALQRIAAGQAEYVPPTPPEAPPEREPEPPRREVVTVVSFEPLGDEPVYDLIVEKNRNFYVITSGDEAGGYVDSRGLLVHNCFEIMLASHGFCVSGDTIITTRTGGGRIADMVGKTVDVWNGREWTPVEPKVTGHDQPLVRVTLSDGSRLDCTPDHRFSVEDPRSPGYGLYQEVPASALKVGAVLEPFVMDRGGESERVPTDAAYTLGVLCGDGSARGILKGWDINLDLCLHGAKKYLPVLGVKDEPYLPKGYSDTAVEVKGFCQAIRDVCDVDPVEFVHSSRADGHALLRVLGWSHHAMRFFLAGMADTDGSETGTGGIRIYAADRRACEALQMIARKCGMRSSLCFMAGRGSHTNFGPRKREMWYVQITECQTIPCYRLDTTRGHAPASKGRHQKVASVEPLPGRHTVYCFNEPKQHKAVFGNVLTHQCNLASVSLPSFGRDFKAIERAVYAVARANYRQTCVDLRDKVLQPRWHQTNEALRLCGVSLTGVVNADWLTDYQIRRLRNAAVTGAYGMADELGLPRPKAVTTLKPEGTRTKITNYGRQREIGEGMHKPLGRFVFNWVNFAAADPMVAALAAAGYRTLPNPSDRNNVLVRFPVDYSGIAFDRGPDGREVNLEPAVKQLERYKRWNTLWADHNVSATISLGDEEVVEVARWLHTHWDDYVATAFLRRADPTLTAADLGHPYLPQEVVTEAAFREAAALCKPVDWDRAHTGVYEIGEASDCAGGVCPVR